MKPIRAALAHHIDVRPVPRPYAASKFAVCTRNSSITSGEGMAIPISEVFAIANEFSTRLLASTPIELKVVRRRGRPIGGNILRSGSQLCRVRQVNDYAWRQPKNLREIAIRERQSLDSGIVDQPTECRAFQLRHLLRRSQPAHWCSPWRLSRKHSARSSRSLSPQWLCESMGCEPSGRHPDRVVSRLEQLHSVEARSRCRYVSRCMGRLVHNQNLGVLHDSPLWDRVQDLRSRLCRASGRGQIPSAVEEIRKT